MARKPRRSLRLLLPLAGAACTVLAFSGLLAAPEGTIAESPEAHQMSTLSNLMSQTQVEQLVAKYKEGLAPGEGIDAAAYAAATNSSTLSPIAKPKVKDISQTEDGILIQWSKVKAAQGYDIYRSVDGNTWEQLAQVGALPSYYHDTDATDGVSYSYAIVATTDEDGYCNSASSTHVEHMFLTAPKVKSSRGSTSVKVTWANAPGATGYEVQYAKNRFFVGAKSVKLDGTSTLSATVKGLSKSSSCYIRVRAVCKAADSTQAGCWSYASNAVANKTAKVSALKVTKKVKSGKKTVKKKVALELRGAAKQKVTGYDTLQGSCYGGGYAFYALYNRALNKGRIVKLSLDKRKVVKVSKALGIYHANDMTFNSKTGRIVVAHAEGDGCGLSIVNPSTLKVEKRISIPKDVSNVFDAASAEVGKVSGISAIAYNAKRDCYVATLGGKHDLLILDASFKPIRLLALSSKSLGIYQNIEVGNDVIAVSTSASALQGGNYLWFYSWTGRELGKALLPKSMEVESVFLKGSKLYAGFYLSGQKMKTKTVVATKKVRNSVGKTVLRKVKQKIKYTAVTRDNYCYKVSGL